MSTKKIHIGSSGSDIPRSHMSWFIQMLLIFAMLTLVGIVYGFWQISQAEGPRLEVPEMPMPQPAP